MASTRTPSRATPGRRRNANKENVYFEPGKQGRKTGLTMPDTGRRDEHGFEQISGIFETPAPPRQSPERPALQFRSTLRSTRKARANEEPEPPLSVRKTPRLPPPRSASPRKSNIRGSAIRHDVHRGESYGRDASTDTTPVPTRALPDDVDSVVHSVERDHETPTTRSKHQSGGSTLRKSIFAIAPSPRSTRRNEPSSPPPGAIDEVSQVLVDGDDFPDPPAEESGLSQIPTAVMRSAAQVRAAPMDDRHTPHTGESNVKRKRGLRKSDSSVVDVTPRPEISSIAREASSSKRRRLDVGVSPAQPSPSEGRARPASPSPLPQYTPQDDEPHPNLDQEEDQFPDEPIQDSAQPDSPAGDDEYMEDAGPEPELDDNEPLEVGSPTPPPPSATKRKYNRRKSALLPKKRTARPAPPRPTTRDTTADSADTLPANTTILGRMRMRSQTPFDDEGVKVTRSGRASIKPLQYWKNETFVYRNGSIDGVIRAEEMSPPESKRPGKGRALQQQLRRKRLGRIDEEEDEDDYDDHGRGVRRWSEYEDHEDLLPEAWEDEVGIIRGPVRSWDAEIGGGGADDKFEDVAFAAPAIKTHEVAGGSFRYAKVLTSPFFGAGLVEIPPGGIKRMKNTRKMQMVFFVHRGKVTVEVSGMKFGATAGGMWQVPRGNNYAIENESSVFPAKIWFAQGCEFDASASVLPAE